MVSISQLISEPQSWGDRPLYRGVGTEGRAEVCGGREAGVGGGRSRIDQALEEADCATFEEEGTITLLGSVSHRRGSQTTRGKAL